MDEYLETWKNSITAKTTDFMVDEETGRAVVEDGPATIGGNDKLDRKAYEEWPLDGFVTLRTWLVPWKLPSSQVDYENKKRAPE